MAFSRRILSLDMFSNSSTPYCNESCTPPVAPPSNFASPLYPDTVEPPIAVNIPIQLDSHKSSQHLIVLILAVAAVIATCFLFLTYYLVLLRIRSLRRRRRRGLVANANPPSDGGGDDDVVEEDIHHVWYIRTVGLDEPTIDSITICPYKRGNGLIESTDCSVCLSEFNEGELVRLLPKCCHAFHIPCIDTWLRSHVNCPLCRAPIVAPPASAAAASAPRADLGSSSSATGEVVEETNAIVSSSSAIASVENPRLPPTVPEEGVEMGSGILVVPESSSSVLGNGFRVQSDLGRCGGRKTADSETNGGLQPVRRSVSMDFSSVGAIFGRVDMEGKDGNFAMRMPTTIVEKEENGPKGVSPHKGPLGMERSLSSTGGKFFQSRFGRGRSNSLLPL